MNWGRFGIKKSFILVSLASKTLIQHGSNIVRKTFSQKSLGAKLEVDFIFWVLMLKFGRMLIPRCSPKLLNTHIKLTMPNGSYDVGQVKPTTCLFCNSEKMGKPVYVCSMSPRH